MFELKDSISKIPSDPSQVEAIDLIAENQQQIEKIKTGIVKKEKV